jgi:hypothetical protein
MIAGRPQVGVAASRQAAGLAWIDSRYGMNGGMMMMMSQGI